ncbi:MAG: DUF92 domain-containing protein, partial [Verrucomicrobiota bacterium]
MVSLAECGWIAVYAIGFGLILWLVALISRAGGWHPETARKTAHVSIGLITISFPWVFERWPPVAILGVIAAVGLFLVRRSQRLRKSVGAALHEVDRQTYGEIFFVVAVALVFALADGDRILYLVPILVLTIADAAGALVGTRYGATSYRTLTGSKSAEGSVTVFFASFLAAHIPLLLFSDLSRSATLLAAFTLALLVALFEAIAFNGLDNLFIPLGGWFALSRFMELGDDELLFRFLVLVAVLSLVIFARSRSSLDGSAMLGAALLGFAVWVLGGWLYFLPLLLYFASHLLETPRVRRAQEKAQRGRRGHDLRAIFSVAATSLLWVGLAAAFPQRDFVVAHALKVAFHIAVGNFGTLAVLRPTWG